MIIKSSNTVSVKTNNMLGKRIGIIGLDAMHAVALTTAINKGTSNQYLGYQVVAAYPNGSKTLPYRIKRVPEYTKAITELGVKIVDSIPELLSQVDAIILTSNDGHVHLEQAIPVLKAGTPLFIDKPLAGNWKDAIAIYQASERYKTPVFSSSSLRFISSIQNLNHEKTGVVLGAHTYSPAQFEPSLPDLLWYAIHGIEMLFAVMGTGCQSVKRIHTEDFDHLVGVWKGGRIGTFRGYRKGRTTYGGTVFGEKANTLLGAFEGYEPLALAIIQFFESKKSPVPLEETLEIISFILAAEESKDKGGECIKLNKI